MERIRILHPQDLTKDELAIVDVAGNLDAPIDALGLSRRSYNRLTGMFGFDAERMVSSATVGAVDATSDDVLLTLSNFGASSLQEVRSKIEAYKTHSIESSSDDVSIK